MLLAGGQVRPEQNTKGVEIMKPFIFKTILITLLAVLISLACALPQLPGPQNNTGAAPGPAPEVTGSSAQATPAAPAALATGFLSGMLGVGGGFIRMPALVYIMGCPTVVAVLASTAFVVVPTAGFWIWADWRMFMPNRSPTMPWRRNVSLPLA